MNRRRLTLLAALLLAGCASTRPGAFPSLAPRAAEREGFAEPSVAPPQAAAPDPALDARVAELAADSARQVAPFRAARAIAEARVAAARGAPAGSAVWLDAQIALGDLDVIRAASSEAATALEQATADRAVAGDVPYPALDAALADANGRLAEVTRTISALNARLSR